MKSIIRKIANAIGKSITLPNPILNDETNLLALGSMLSKQQWQMTSNSLNDYEFRIFSQWGDDGIIQYLIKFVEVKNKTFIEFGVENYQESNTRFLMMNDNWQGFVMDGAEKNMNSLQSQSYFWKYDLTCKAVFLDKENINGLLAETGFSDIGILSVDIDGNDYHILKEIDLKKLNPSIIILEYNSVFGKDRAITVPYDKKFIRTNAHYSNLYYGASLPALCYLAKQKGYGFIGCNNAGNNAYFVRKDLLNTRITEVPVSIGFKESKFRESRDKNGNLSLLSGLDRLRLLEGLDVINVVTGDIEKL